MHLKDLIFALETFQVDLETGHQIIGKRPDIPVVTTDQIVDIVFYVNHDKVTDHKLLKTAQVAFAKYGNIPVIQKGVVEVVKEVIKEVEKKPVTKKASAKKSATKTSAKK